MSLSLTLGTEVVSQKPVVITEQELRRHIHILGRSGTGKTALLASLIQQTIEQGGGALVVDPHGELIENLLKHIPAQRAADIVSFKPSENIPPTSMTEKLTETIENNKVLLANLAKGDLGVEASRTWGRKILADISSIMLSRRGKTGLTPFSIYLDEVQDWAKEDLEALYVEARACSVSLVISHQYLGQLSDDLRDLLFGNVGNLITFRVGLEDAEYLDKEFHPYFPKEHFMELPLYQAVLKKMQVDNGGISVNEFKALSPLNPIAA